MHNAHVSPSLRHRDARGAIEWPCEASGFGKRSVRADGGVVHHAQLNFGNGMLMPGSTDHHSEWGRQVAQPGDIGILETQSPYLIVADPDAHSPCAKAAGAQIVVEIKDEDCRGLGYSCRDPEGHLRNFGSHDPWRGADA